MRYAKEHVGLLASVFVVLVIIYLSIIYIDQNGYVTDEEISNYVDTYIETYRNLAETKITHPDNRTYLEFYNKNPYFVKSIVSITHGAGLEFIPSKNFAIEVIITDKNSEDLLFNIPNAQSWPMFILHNGIVIEGGQFDTNGHPFIYVEEYGSVLLKNVTVNNIYHFMVIAKGSNRKKDWSAQSAFQDAADQFERDAIDAFWKSEDFRRYLAYPKLSGLAGVIVERQNSDYYKDLLTEQADFEELHETAKMYFVSTQFSDDIYKFIKEKDQTPSWWKQYDVYGKLWDIALTLFLILAAFLYKRYNTDIKSLLGKKEN
jgi:hypothetical protein